MDRVKCEEIRIYFSKREKRVLDVLDGYAAGNWEALKEELRSLYTSSAGKRTYQPRDIQHYIAKKREHLDSGLELSREYESDIEGFELSPSPCTGEHCRIMIEMITFGLAYDLRV